jgi:hypothetical protein
MRKAKSPRSKDSCDEETALRSAQRSSVTRLSLLDSGRLSGAWHGSAVAQNGGQGKLQDHASIPGAVTSTDFSPENLCGKELRNPWLVQRTLFSGNWKKGRGKILAVRKVDVLLPCFARKRTR